MKMNLRWTEHCEVVREFPEFVLDSEKFPELELEMLQVHNAGSLQERSSALDNLEYKMHHTETERGETIFQMVGPHEREKYMDSIVYPITEEVGSLQLVEEN